MGRIINGKYPTIRDLTIPVPVSKGGLGSNNPYRSVKNIKGIHITDVNKPNSIAKAENGTYTLKLSQINLQLSPRPTIRGNMNVTTGSSTVYAISNYSEFQTYTLEAIAGSVSRTGKNITYVAPTGGGVHGFKVNGRTIPVTVTGTMVVTPSILTPVDNTANLGPDVLFISSDFATLGASDTHYGSDWQFANDIEFTDIISTLSLTNDTVAKTQLNVQLPDTAKSYYARVRHKGSVIGYSGWSVPIRVISKSVFVPTNELAKLAANDGMIADNFGSSVAMSGDGNTVAVAAQLADVAGVVNCGAVYLFERNGTSYTFKTKLSASDKATSDEFGSSIALNEDGTVLVVGAWHSSPSSVNQAGAAYIFNKVNGTWSQTAKLTAADKASVSYFGFAVAVNGGGNIVAIGAPFSTGNSQPNGGAVYIYTKSGSAWNQSVRLVPNSLTAASYFGYSLDINQSATALVVGAPGFSSAGNSDAGAIYVYNFLTSWTETAKLHPSVVKTAAQVGKSVAIDETGTTVTAGAPLLDDTESGIADCGYVYVFKYATGAWTQSAMLSRANKTAGDQYGNAVKLDSTGSKLFVAGWSIDSNGIANCGQVDQYQYSGTAWSLIQSTKASDKGTGDFFGSSISINNQGSRLAVGAYLADVLSIQDAGACYIYS